ncbi:MAG: hypothetical protein CL730_00825 [Chloroflexi bacterium]|nr:hypothetical protein [Chloroflexota bacterium]|tara:strand:- start:9610 stop:10326 length:717 start_codon:yes stop_codon:yes gene_type:complete
MFDFNTNKILITGTKSGLGKYLSSFIKGTTNIETQNELNLHKSSSFKIIIHCAGSNSHRFKDFLKLIKNNIILTYKLLRFRSDLFVFFSTVDIFSDKFNFFSLTKYISERIIIFFHSNFLIYRCSAMLGIDMRNNHVNKILSFKTEKLNLSFESEFRYITHQSIFEQILEDINSNKKGIFTLTSKNPKNLKFFCDHYANNKIGFGEYVYKTKISDKYPIIFLDDSEKNFKSYVNLLNE